MLTLMYRRLCSGFRPAAAPTALALALGLTFAVCDARAASITISNQSGIGQDVLSASNVPARDVLGSGESDGDHAVAEQIFQSEFTSARSVASFARDAKKVGVSTNEDFTSLLPMGATESGPMGLSGRGLFNTISALHGPRATPSNVISSEVDVTGITAKSAADQALAQFWEQSASADAAFNLGDSSGGVAAGPGTSNVLIPLPAAAWSALSVLGAMGAARAIRRRSGR